MKTKSRDLFFPANERIKYNYRIHQRRALKKDDKTITALLKHIREYELFTNFIDFRHFTDKIADKYITAMTEQGTSLSYINDNLRVLKEFFRWLERQRGYKGKIHYNHIDYLSLTNNQRRTAKATAYKKSYKYDQILTTIRAMPEFTAIQKRNKAMISLQALCGLRISELRTVKLKNLIQEEGYYFIHVNPKDMQVKFAKSRHADFIGLPKDIVDNVLTWRDYLIAHGFKEKDTLFPQIPHQFGQSSFLETNPQHRPIQSNTTILNTFRKAFEAAGYEYYRPHSFRHTIARYAEKQTPEFLNAVRQALGHSSIDTTIQSYGQLSESEQRRRIGQHAYISINQVSL
ncbi:MAG: site-specific integrase [Alphaproteobacteria bacterium]|nr:site-specific integrase [Alphaproteobacteria bacterium]